MKLWQAFAEIEWLSGNTDEARRVFDSTLMMGGEMFSDEQSRRTALAPLVRYLYNPATKGHTQINVEPQINPGTSITHQNSTLKTQHLFKACCLLCLSIVCKLLNSKPSN